MKHELKSWTHLFEEIRTGIKTHELRKNDRHYAIGDILVLHEYDPIEKKFSGRTLKLTVTYVTSIDVPCAESRSALHKDYCILSVRKEADSNI